MPVSINGVSYGPYGKILDQSKQYLPVLNRRRIPGVTDEDGVYETGVYETGVYVEDTP